MERRDYIVDEIQKFGQMVMALFGKLVKKRQSEQYDFDLSMADYEFESEAGFSLKMLIGMDTTSLKNFLAQHPELNFENMELLANLLIEISDQPGIAAVPCLERAGELLQLVDEQSKTYSVERAGKLAYISEILINGKIPS